MQLIRLAMMAKGYIESLFEREEGQDVFEYLLIIAGISVVIIAAGALAVPGLFEEVVFALCGAISDMDNIPLGEGNGIEVECTDPSP